MHAGVCACSCVSVSFQVEKQRKHLHLHPMPITSLNPPLTPRPPLLCSSTTYCEASSSSSSFFFYPQSRLQVSACLHSFTCFLLCAKNACDFPHVCIGSEMYTEKVIWSFAFSPCSMVLTIIHVSASAIHHRLLFRGGSGWGLHPVFGDILKQIKQ